MRSNIRLFSADAQVSYKGIFFPGGEPHVEIEYPEMLDRADALVDARVGSMNDLGMLLALTDAVRRCRPRSLNLHLPYFPGARQDREEKGYALTAQVYADLINLQGYDRVFVLDPHSAVTPALLHNCIVLPHIPLVQEFLKRASLALVASGLEDPASSAAGGLKGIICPDAGAERRSLELGQALGGVPVIFARKKRDPRTGKLSGFSSEPLPAEGTYLLADDLCDGGGTFVGLADTLLQVDPHGGANFLLWTTHGVYSKGLDELSKRFACVGCSDSFPFPEDLFEDQRLTVIPTPKPTWRAS